jgi:short-subunit dehydrogenase
LNRGLTQIHYNSAKAAVIHLTKSLAVEWIAGGVRVNSSPAASFVTGVDLLVDGGFCCW